MIRWAAILLLGLFMTGGCETASENAGSASGPGIDVDCALKRQRLALLPGQGVGNTEVDVECAPPE